MERTLLDSSNSAALGCGAGLTFLCGLFFKELVNSTTGSSFFKKVSSTAPVNSLQKFANPAFLSIASFLCVLIVSFIFTKSRRGHWMGAILLAVLLLIIDTHLTNSFNLAKALPPELSAGGEGIFMENGLNIQLDIRGTIPLLDAQSVHCWHQTQVYHLYYLPVIAV